MGTLTALLNLSQSALQANQAAIDITSNNVANANTPGYTDEVATWRESDTVKLSGTVGAAEGASVSAASQRDSVLNHRVQQQTQLEASSSAESTALTDLQSIFGITSTSTSPVSTAIGTSMNSFFNSLSALEASPSDSSVRQNVLSAAADMAAEFNGAANQISQQSAGLNQQIPGVLGQVNSLTASIAALNLQIGSSSPNADAGTLEDQRQQDLTQLSTLIGFDQTKTENNGLTLTTANGVLLVSEGQSFALGTDEKSGNLTIVSSTGQDLTSSLTGGALGGMLQARDQDLPQISAALDSLAYAIGTAVNTQNQAGLDANGNPGGCHLRLARNPNRRRCTISSIRHQPRCNRGRSRGRRHDRRRQCYRPQRHRQHSAGRRPNSGTILRIDVDPAWHCRGRHRGREHNPAGVADTTHNPAEFAILRLAGPGSSQPHPLRALLRCRRQSITIVDQLMASALNLGEETTVT